MASRIFCDHCGAEIERRLHTVQLCEDVGELRATLFSRDLCESCKDELLVFLSGEQPKRRKLRIEKMVEEYDVDQKCDKCRSCAYSAPGECVHSEVENIAMLDEGAIKWLFEEVEDDGE